MQISAADAREERRPVFAYLKIYIGSNRDGYNSIFNYRNEKIYTFKLSINKRRRPLLELLTAFLHGLRRLIETQTRRNYTGFNPHLNYYQKRCTIADETIP